MPDDKKRENLKPGAPSPDADSADAVMAAAGEESLSAEIDRLASDLQKAQEQTLRAQAELDNFRKRMLREMEQERRFALMPLIQDLLPVIDNLDRALQSASQAEANAGVVTGVKMVADQFRDALQRHHCQPIEAQGAAFDPNLHQAISRQVTKDHPPGTVLHVAQSGWRLHDRVVRPAQVIVAAEPEEN